MKETEEIKVTVNQYMKMTNKFQQCRIIYCSLAALHVSSDTFAHHQGHLNCIYSLWYYTCVVVAASFMGELELSHETGQQQLT
jgi:hypothetical protein